MHTLTIQTKFTFGDRVKYFSPTQGGISGSGKIEIITVGSDGSIDYGILDEDGDIQPGILENEITLIEGASG